MVVFGLAANKQRDGISGDFRLVVVSVVVRGWDERGRVRLVLD